MYHVIGTGLTSVLLYLISYFFYRLKYFPLQFHNKLWNSVLAVTFLATAIAGVFMALQVTYKWDLPFVKTVLKWHVEFGIGMTFTGIFHFIWHFSYYRKLFKRQEYIVESEVSQRLTARQMGINLFIVGLVSSSLQLLLLREMLNISGGYELITGIFFGSWLISSAIGASLAGRSKLHDLKKINLVFSLSPLLSLFMMFLLSRLFLNTGETPSLLVGLIYTFLVLIPFCLVSGFTFVRLISFARDCNNFTPGKSFSIETIGGVASGVLISALTSGLLNTYQLILLIILLTFSWVMISFYLKSNPGRLSAKLIASILAAVIIILSPDVIFRQILLPGIKVTGSEDTPYGNITYGDYHGEKSTYYNQRLLSYADDVTEREENIHYAMLQSGSPEKIILISGPLRSQLTELMKYPVKEITYIERDPALAREEIIRADTLHFKLSVINSDAFRYIRKPGEKADVIILSVPPPSTLQLNRYYTTEFFSAVRQKLNSDGIFMCSPGPGNNYFNKESLRLYSSIFNSLSEVFKDVKPVVGNKLYFIASDSEISASFCSLTEKRNIKNIYVGPDFLSDDLINKKSDELNLLLDRGIKQNRSSFPVASLHLLSYNFSKNMDEKIPAIVIMIMIFALPLMSIKRRYMLMYFSASALAGFEIIILLTLQTIIGNMYQLTGLIIAGLMGGLALGSGAGLKNLNSVSMITKGILLLIFYTGIAVIFNYFLSIKSEIASLVLIIISAFLPALLTGNIFRQLTSGPDDISAPPAVYSSDLAGSALGFILISGIAIPAFGIRSSILILALLIFTGLLFGAVRNKL